MNDYPTSSDYAKCEGTLCKKKGTCWRYLMPCSKYQVYLVVDDPKKCEQYWEYKTKKVN